MTAADCCLIPRILGTIILVGLASGCNESAPASSIAPRESSDPIAAHLPDVALPIQYKPRQKAEIGGYGMIIENMPRWPIKATSREIAEHWKEAGFRHAARTDQQLSAASSNEQRIMLLVTKAMALNYEGEAKRAYQELEQARALLNDVPEMAQDVLYTIIYSQGVTALRRGENENCILCRGESSCILPISSAAVHIQPEGSRLAIEHFTEYLQQFPDDLQARWLLNLAHMTLGEHPDKVDPQYLVSLDRFRQSEFDIGRFRDVGHLVGINRLNQSGGAILEDFDNDGLLDFAVTSFDAAQVMGFYRNTGDGTFENRTAAAGLEDQFGGLYCVQTDFNNDGYKDIFIPRGAWLKQAMRPSLLENNRDGTFTDMTEAAGLLDPVNSNSASWADFDNDGWLDLFIACEQQTQRLYRNRGNGTFEDVSKAAGVAGTNRDFCKAGAWIDYDNDGAPDLFINNLGAPAKLYHNNRDGTFSNVTREMGIDGPKESGFSCWAWDYDNDGWQDIFATCYDRSVSDVVKGLIGEPDEMRSGKLYRNVDGQRFQDVTAEAGLDLVFATMGSNFADFDNDGYLDMYLGTGDPQLSTLIPNRMFKNVAGQRFAEISGSTGTGHLQKGHAVACGDWDRDGDVDVFIEMGGAINGDKYHNILFQNPGQGNHSLTVKLVGTKTNRAAIGARIKVITDGENPLTLHRHVTSGSTFGANALEQTIGIGKAERIATLEIHWPTSNTTQVFHDVAADQMIEIVEFEDRYRTLETKRIALPADTGAM